MRKLKSLFAIAAAALAVLAAPNLAKADKLQDVLGSGKLRIGILTDAAPWGFKDDKGEIAGLDGDLARLIAADMGGKLARVTAAALAALLAGQADSFAENSAIALKVQEQNPAKDVELKFLIRQSPAHVGVRQGEQNLLNWINTDIFTNKLNGKLGALQLKWFKEEQLLPTL